MTPKNSFRNPDSQDISKGRQETSGDKYQVKMQKKFCRTSCWNVPGRAVRMSQDIRQGRPESHCYGESLPLRPKKRTSFLSNPSAQPCQSLLTGLIVVTLADGETLTKAIDVTTDVGAS